MVNFYSFLTLKVPVFTDNEAEERDSCPKDLESKNKSCGQKGVSKTRVLLSENTEKALRSKRSPGRVATRGS